MYRRRLRQRLAIAQRLARDSSITRLQRENQIVSETALRSAQEDEHVFDRLFGEPLPAMLHAALRLERETWKTLIETQQRLAPDQNRRLLRAIQTVLATEEAILTSPLTKRYERRLEQLRKEELRTGR